MNRIGWQIQQPAKAASDPRALRAHGQRRLEELRH